MMVAAGLRENLHAAAVVLPKLHDVRSVVLERYGLVGGAPGKINLYVGKTPVKFNVPQEEAVERLVDLIKEKGRWVEA